MAAFLLLIAGLAAGFVIIIARKGRALRKNQPLPPPSAEAFILWDEEGRKTELKVETPFYFGKDPECQIVIPVARNKFEACIFYHQSRFAFQTLPGGGVILINGEETPAGYLWDGDILRVGDREFTFRCY